MGFNKEKKTRQKRSLRSFFLYRLIFFGFLFFLILFGFLTNIFLWKTKKPSFSVYSYQLRDSFHETEGLSGEKRDFSLKHLRTSASVAKDLKKTGQGASSFLNSQSMKSERMDFLIREQEQRRIRHLKVVKDFFDERIKPFVSHMGRAPSLRDKLRYGELKGRYLLRFYDGKLETIQFLNLKNNSYQPVSFLGVEAWLRSYQVFFPGALDLKKVSPYKVQRVERKGTFFYETYLFNSDFQEKRKLQFKIDSKNRLISLKLEDFFEN